MTYTLAELKELIAERYDPDEFVDMLDISTEMLVEAFEDLIIEKRSKFDGYEESDSEESADY